MARLPADPRRLAPALLAAAVAGATLLLQPPSLDLAAAEYRAWLFGHAGLAAYDLQWYGGHHLPGYSVLYPPLGWWLGPRLVGALAAVATTLLFQHLARARYGERAWLGTLWFALGASATLLSGRIVFLLGVVPALGTLVALQRRHGARERRALLAVLVLVLALVTPLASPVAALFLALAGVAYAIAVRAPIGIAVAVAALAPVLALAWAFPEGGAEPFVASAFWPVPVFALVTLVLMPREERGVRIGVALYALGAIAAFALATPVGGNVTRLGTLCAGPVAALLLWRRRTLALVLVAPLLLWWQWSPPVHDLALAGGDPSVHASYYAPLLARLERPGAAPGRVEIPFTRVHWEARWVAPHVPLARGWERQLDVERDALFYDGRLTPARYRAWLRALAVRWVALPDVPLDYSARAEGRLVAGEPPYLREVWHDRHWRLYEVRDPAPLADPPARVVALDTAAITLAVPHAATVLLRVRWTPYWTISQGAACVAPAGDWTRLQARRPGRVRLAIDVGPGRIAARSARCAGREASRPMGDG